VCIGESEENNAEKQHFVEVQIVQKDVKENNVVAKE
jgi:hypothetical protein